MVDPHTKKACQTCSAFGQVPAEIADEYILTHPHSPFARSFDDMPTRVPCPLCQNCLECNGTRSVTPKKASEIRARMLAKSTK